MGIFTQPLNQNRQPNQRRKDNYDGGDWDSDDDDNYNHDSDSGDSGDSD